MLKKISILLIDDHKLLRDVWATVLGSDMRFRIVGSTGDTDEALQLTKTKNPEVVLLDINLPGTTGFHLSKELQKVSPYSKIIAVTMYALPAYAKRMMQTGASGYVTKNSSKEEMIDAIIKVAAGDKYVCHDIKEKIALNVLNAEEGETDIESLTRRELEIIKLLQQGLSSKIIGEQLDVSQKTIEVHRYHILKKLNLKNTASLINLVNQRGL
ncbi:MAG: response regulator transcription factor [Chitinophagaceae bacterium]|nr:response regulator transcription factor [Chitinophagaceae bacterium]